MKLSLSEMLALIGIPFLVAATIATIIGLNKPRIRNFIFVVLAIGVAYILGIISWPIIWQWDQITSTHPSPRPSPPVKVSPSPTPSPPKSKPTPEDEPPSVSEESYAAEAVSLHASSLDDPSARAKYCVVGEFIGESRDNRKALDVLFSEVNISLCNYSAHGPRKVKMKVGYPGGRRGSMIWSRSVTLSENLAPGETLTLSSPIHLSIPKRGKTKVSNDKLVIQLSNAPCNTNRENRYYIPSENNGLIAQLGSY